MPPHSPLTFAEGEFETLRVLHAVVDDDSGATELLSEVRLSDLEVAAGGVDGGAEDEAAEVFGELGVRAGLDPTDVRAGPQRQEERQPGEVLVREVSVAAVA